jgi:hypothetical protein
MTEPVMAQAPPTVAPTRRKADPEARVFEARVSFE